MRIVLIRPVYRTSLYDPEIQEPLGIETLAGYLRSYGHQVLLLDPMLSMQSEDIAVRRAVGFQPEILGFSAMSSGDIDSIILVKGIKSHEILIKKPNL